MASLLGDDLGPADRLRARALRRMQAVAVGLLLIAAAIYLATLAHRDEGAWGYVNAAAEAAMVGGLADWFAVTALFRHPLGLPIPHTALIPRRKNELGRSLQEFFSENFLTDEIVRGRTADARVAARAGSWLARSGNAERVMRHAARGAVSALRRVDDDEIRSVLETILVPQLAREPVSELAGEMLEAIVDDGAHQGLVDLVLVEVARWLDEHPEQFAEVVRDRAPSWSPSWLDRSVVRVTYAQAQRWVSDVHADPRHPARLAFDELLRGLSVDLQHDGETQARMQDVLARLVQHQQFVEGALAVWRSTSGALVVALGDPTSHVWVRGTEVIREIGVQLDQDAELCARVQRRLEDVAAFGIETYGGELAAVITHTIESWDGELAARRIELHVGRDLQFIRVNGTLVGALAGLAIHGASQLVA